MSDDKNMLIERAFADGFFTALTQLETQILSKYAKDLLNIEKAVDFLNAPADDRLKVLTAQMQVGSLLSFIGKLKNVVKDVMNGKEPEENKAVKPGQLDGGVILQ